MLLCQNLKKDPGSTIVSTSTSTVLFGCQGILYMLVTSRRFSYQSRWLSCDRGIFPTQQKCFHAMRNCRTYSSQLFLVRLDWRIQREYSMGMQTGKRAGLRKGKIICHEQKLEITWYKFSRNRHTHARTFNEGRDESSQARQEKSFSREHCCSRLNVFDPMIL